MNCSVEGCEKEARARGWCQAHYRRWYRHGSPVAGRTPDGEALRFYHEVVLTYEGLDCLAWPFARNAYGYGVLQIGDKIEIVSRAVCEETKGPPPAPELQAAHSCGMGGSGCVAKRHLSWKTRAENEADKLIHGTHNRGRRRAVPTMEGIQNG